jgi:hypothetical protein
MGITIFELDESTPHPGVVVDADGLATRDTNGGWVTLRSSQPLTAAAHQWAVRIMDHGEGSDGSGLMVGLLPRLPAPSAAMMGSKYISELGGWCLSRAGECYGAWKCERIPFTSGCVVEFDVDLQARTLHIVCGKEVSVGHIPAIGDSEELYPAVSMYYMNQKVAFV